MVTEDKKLIGKKAWVLDGDIRHGLTLGSKETYTIKGFKKGYPGTRIWNTIILERDSDGAVSEQPTYKVVIALQGDNIYQYLLDNEVCAYVDDTAEGNVIVEISWGDWKHEHLWCKDLMGYIGYVRTDELVTEEDGGDCYSAIHTYIKNA